jgi:hypothetical protein
MLYWRVGIETVQPARMSGSSSVAAPKVVRGQHCLAIIVLHNLGKRQRSPEHARKHIAHGLEL